MTDICAFCLSNNRTLYSIRDEHWLSFYSLLDGDDAQYMKYLHTESLLRLCWECRARLHGFSKFVRSAQQCVGILRSYWACPTEALPSSLSNLYRTSPELTDISPSLEHTSDVGEIVKIEFELSQPPELTSDKPSIKLENEIIDKESLFEALTEGAGFQADDDDGDEKVEGIEQVNLPESKKEGRRKKTVKKKVKVAKSPRTRKTARTKRYHTTWMSHDRASQCYESERDTSAGRTDCNTEPAGIYICDMCQHRFDDQPALQQHIEGHYTLYKCRVCEYETRVLADIEAHKTHIREAERGGKKKGGNECKKCKISFETASLLRKHRSKCSLFKCDFCDKAFVHRTSKYSHMDLHHKPLPQVECKLCGKQFKNKYAIKSHLQKHRKEARGSNYTCTVCQVDYKTAIAFRQHFYKTVRIDGREEFRNECAHCEIKFSSPKRLQEHISNVHAKKATYRCDKCHKSYMQQKALDAHIANKHQSTKPVRDKICDVCGKRFTSTTILRNHMRSHTGEKPYKCTLCGAAFAHTGSLYTHNKLLHKKKKMPHAHVDMQMYQCPDCSKEFVSEARWRSHYDFFHLKKSKYACEICNKIFISAWNLKNHKTMLHGINRTRSFPCNICGKEFFRIDALKSHKLIHSEERTFMCSECGKTFKQQAALYTHTKLVHKGIKRPPAKPSTKRVKKPAVDTQMELEAKFV